MKGRIILMAMIVTLGLGAMGCSDSFYRSCYNARDNNFCCYRTAPPACDNDNSIIGSLVSSLMDGLTDNGHDLGRPRNRSH